MNEDISRLEAKIDMLTELVTALEQKLAQVLIIPKYPTKGVPHKKSKEEVKSQAMIFVERWIALRPHAIRCQRMFNLKMQPHIDRVERYLQTNDPAAFDGLKRND